MVGSGRSSQVTSQWSSWTHFIPELSVGAIYQGFIRHPHPGCFLGTGRWAPYPRRKQGFGTNCVVCVNNLRPGTIHQLGGGTLPKSELQMQASQGR